MAQVSSSTLGDKEENAFALLVKLHTPRQKEKDTGEKSGKHKQRQKEFKAYPTQQSNGVTSRGDTAARDGAIARNSQRMRGR